MNIGLWKQIKRDIPFVKYNTPFKIRGKIMRLYPELVNRLTVNHNGWIIGSAADPDNKDPKDWDIWIPVEEWHKAVCILPKDFTINSMGGFKCISEGQEVDVWTCSMEHMFTKKYFKWAFYPNAKIRIKSVEN